MTTSQGDEVLPRSPTRLLRNEASRAQHHVHGAIVVTALAALAVLGAQTPTIALLAAGAGAGYSLSGSV